jgi:hypothetical protein
MRNILSSPANCPQCHRLKCTVLARVTYVDHRDPTRQHMTRGFTGQSEDEIRLKARYEIGARYYITNFQFTHVPKG